jgi:hypothetical protein
MTGSERLAHIRAALDVGGALRLARRPPGWLERAERIVAAEGFNFNRRGVVFVPAVAGRDIALRAVRLADASRAVYLALLELEDVVRPWVRIGP